MQHGSFGSHPASLNLFSTFSKGDRLIEVKEASSDMFFERAPQSAEFNGFKVCHFVEF